MSRPPTPAMIAVLRKMADGWQMGHSSGIDGRAWIQKEGLGRGGESENVHVSCSHGMFTRGLIEWEDGFPWSTATLTAKGKEAADG